MDALILAAGLGSRLRAAEPCKPLALLHGIPLLELAVRQLAAAGTTRAVVATGHRAELVEAALPAISRRAGIPVTPQRVDDCRKPNGHSVIAGSRDFGSDFLLVMADHVFSRHLLAILVEGEPAGDGAVLAIDRRVTSSLLDPEDATWVKLGAGTEIARIGKHLDRYDAVDCGAFRASPALPEAIAEAIRAGRPGSLSDGMQRLADAGRARTVDIGDAWWIDIDDVRALEIAQQQVGEHLPEVFGHAGLTA